MRPEDELSRLHALLDHGDWVRAREGAEHALRVFPDQAQFWVVLGISLHQLGKASDALASFHGALRHEPSCVPAINGVSMLLSEQGRHAEALEFLDRAAEANPADASVWFNKGCVLDKAGRQPEALAAYDKALACNSRFAPAWLNRGADLMMLRRYDEAVENNRCLAGVLPKSADALANLAEALLGLGRSGEALETCARAVALDPGHARTHIDRGLALSDLGRFDEAQSAFDLAESFAPGAVQAYLNTIAPSDPAHKRTWDPRLVFLYRGYERLVHCDWSMRDIYIERLVDLVRAAGDSGSRHIDIPLAYHALTIPVPLDVPYRISCAIGDRYAAAIAKTDVRFDHPRRSGRLRVGYLSPDFREHLNAYLAYPLFRMHDRNRFEVFAYNIGPNDGSEIREKIRSNADRFADLSGTSDCDAARRINADGVDVLVDFGGYTQYCRPGICAFRPAAVQISCIGFPGTTGAPWMDYRITDRVATPQAQERRWSEKLVYLPDTFFIYDCDEHLPDLALSRGEYGLPGDAFVFCAFNNYYKIEPEIFSVWIRILKAVPSGVLWLAGRDPLAGANLRREAEKRGVCGERLLFAPFESRQRYRARFRLADLYLDTPIFNAMTTACDALATGLPLLTITGEAFPSRVATSLLNAAGFPQGITRSLEEYADRAITWGRHPEVLREIRSRLLGEPLKKSLFDTGARVQQLEAAYIEMWRRHQAGLPPKSFDVVARPPEAPLHSAWH